MKKLELLADCYISGRIRYCSRCSCSFIRYKLFARKQRGLNICILTFSAKYSRVSQFPPLNQCFLKVGPTSKLKMVGQSNVSHVGLVLLNQDFFSSASTQCTMLGNVCVARKINIEVLENKNTKETKAWQNINKMNYYIVWFIIVFLKVLSNISIFEYIYFFNPRKEIKHTIGMSFCCHGTWSPMMSQHH